MQQQNRLVALCEELCLGDDALDEVVHDLAQEDTLDELNGTDNEDEQEDIISGSEERAGDINNGGFEDQVKFLLERCGARETERIIREAA
jgi:hypothetical protein